MSCREAPRLDADSQSVVIGNELAAGLTDLPVVPDARGEGEQPLRDAGDETGRGAAAVALERQLALERPDDRLDPLPDRAEPAEAGALVPAIGTHQSGPEGGHGPLELLAREALVGGDGAAGEVDPGEQVLGHLALRGVGRRELEADRHAVRRADQVEAKAPEGARVGGAVAVGGVARELR